MTKKRDYKAEYQKRIEQGLAKGLSKSQARGHGKVKPVKYDRRLEEGVKEIRKGKSLTRAAKSIHAAPETLRKYLNQSGIAKKEKGKFRIGKDQRLREMIIFSGGREHTITIKGYEVSAEIGNYMSAVNQFLSTNDPSVLEPFKNQFIHDSKGKKYIFETRPNVLYRLNQSSTDSFEEVYRIVA
jgi:hypothetical protein